MYTPPNAWYGSMLGGDPLVASAQAKQDDVSIPGVDPLVLLMSRTSYGIREEELTAARRAGYEAWLEYQLAHDAISDAELETVIQQNFPTVGMSTAQILQRVRDGGPQVEALQQLQAATLVRQVYSPRQLFEVMVEFWTNHFNVSGQDGVVRYYKTVDDREIRANAMGRFGDLLRANARSPAMLFYLDNYINIASGPNENYARELMELHTLGVNGGYTEEDVQNVARAFTGWTFTPYNPPQGSYSVQFTFVRARHDLRAKRVLGVDMPANRGIEDGNQVLDILINHPSTARFLATKLVRRFVADVPPAALVERVASVYMRTQGDIREMLRTILTSQEFINSGDLKIKRPVEFAVSTLRATGAQLTGNWARGVLETINALGQQHFGWPAPNGYPDVGGYWVNASAMLTRWNNALAIGNNTAAGIRWNADALVPATLRTPAEIVDRLAQRLLRRTLAPEDRAKFIEYAAAGARADAPLAAAARTPRIRELVGAMLSSPYFMYR